MKSPTVKTASPHQAAVIDHPAARAVDEPNASPKPEKTGLLQTSLSRSIVIAAALVGAVWAVTAALTDRYMMVAAPRSENAFAYRVDRLTGNVAFCSPGGCSKISDRKTD